MLGVFLIVCGVCACPCSSCVDLCCYVLSLCCLRSVCVRPVSSVLSLTFAVSCLDIVLFETFFHVVFHACLLLFVLFCPCFGLYAVLVFFLIVCHCLAFLL